MCPKVSNDIFVSPSLLSCVGIKTGDFYCRENSRKFTFDFFRSDSGKFEKCFFTLPASLGNRFLMVAIVAYQLVIGLVIGQRNGAIGALHDLTAFDALNMGGKSAPV